MRRGSNDDRCSLDGRSTGMLIGSWFMNIYKKIYKEHAQRVIVRNLLMVGPACDELVPARRVGICYWIKS